MNDFKIGDRVLHSMHGLGTVGWIGPDYIGVEFDLYGKVLLKREAAEMRQATSVDEEQVLSGAPDEAMTEATTSAEPFFVHESAEGAHAMGSHWQPFFDDVKPVILQLPQILASANLYGGYSELSPPPAQANVKDPHGALFIASSETIADFMGFECKPHRWDDRIPWRSPGGALDDTPENVQETTARATGVATIIRLATSSDESNMVQSMFPYCFHGIEQTVMLDRVYVWENGLEAQLEGSLGDAGIAFYDIDFVNNQGWYQRGHRYQFVLVGLAYHAAPAQAFHFTISRTKEHFDGMTWLIGQDQMPDNGVLEESFDLGTMSMLLPIPEWDIDDHEFQGPIKELWGMSMLGLRAWRARVTVVRDAPDDLDLDIVITERSWDGEVPPQPGQIIKGRMWLQGRLWMRTPDIPED